MSLLRRILGGGRPPATPLIRVAPRPRRIVELEDEGSFALTLQQAEDVRRNAPFRGERRQKVQVMIVVSSDQKEWRDVEEFWTGPWRPSWEGGIPLPTEADLIEVGRREAAQDPRVRYVRSQVRSTI